MIASSRQAATREPGMLVFSDEQIASARLGLRSPTATSLMPASTELPADTSAVAVLSRPLVPAFSNALEVLAKELSQTQTTVVVIVPWKAAPTSGTRPDGVVDSFLCDGATFRALRARTKTLAAGQLCFALLNEILNERLSVQRILVRQLPLPPCEPVPPRTERATLVMAHRGEPRHLSAALRSIAAADGAERIAVRVGLDVDELSDYRSIVARSARTTFFHVDPAPAGLFVVRQHLLELAHEELFYLQDSDDLSCTDRFTAQSDELHRRGCDVVGCHELRIDEVAGTVEAFRLPLDVQRALDSGYSESLLNGTIVARRGAVLNAGGYSTDQRIALDTQFMLRAYFSLRMRNVDGFYYLRRSHKASLTVAPDTGFGTPLRTRLRDIWAADFDAVRSGRLRLEQSCLRQMASTIAYRLREIEP